MSTPSAEGAAAAATFFTSDLYQYVYASGDLSGWKELSDPECAFCTSVTEDIARMSEFGHRTSAFSVSVDSAVGTEIYPGESYSARLRVTQGKSEELDRLGKVVDRADGGSYELLVALTWTDRWVVREIDVDRQDLPANG